jgi:hypothetical protein
MIMRFVVKISLAMLLLACLVVSAQAAQLFPLQTGRWMEMDKHDNSGNTWTVRMMVLEEVTRDQKQYFRVQELYYDPYGTDGGDTFSEFYIRSTETEVWFYNGVGETLAFKNGNQDEFWEDQDEGRTIRKEIVSTNDSITIPYGGTYSAYKYKHYDILEPTRYDLEWVVPGLGLVKEEDHWTDLSQTGRIPLNSALARVGSNPLFIPLKTGMRLTYDARDNQNNTWKMKIEVKEQVTLNDNETYFHMRQTDYDPIGGDVDNEFYVRCNASQVYARKLNENPAHLEYQAAGPETIWNYQKTVMIYKRITGIQPVNVLGRSFLAYVTDQSPNPSFPDTFLMSEFVVPGLGPVKMSDWLIAESNRAPLQFILTGITQGSPNGAVNLLLMD